MSHTFWHCSKLTSLNVSNFNTSNVKTMLDMFSGCSNLTEIIGIEKFDTSKVENFAQMFNNCSKLTNINVSNFDTSNACLLYTSRCV